MKKILLILLFCLSTFSANAEIFSNCIPFTARNGKRFCYRSNGGSDWLYAISWCDAQGLRLATPNELCDIDEKPWNKMNVTTHYIGCPNVLKTDQTLVDNMEERIYWLRGLNQDNGAYVTQGIGTILTNNPTWGRTPLCAMD